MTRRTTAHANEDIARSLLRQAFATAGWAINDLHSDYGEDLLVRIFKNGKATPFAFYVQSKSVANVSKRLAKDGRSISQKVTALHLRSWATMREPVILAVTDVKTKQTYWECVQTNLKCQDSVNEETVQNKSVTIAIPKENTLDESGLQTIEGIAQSLYHIANRERVALWALAQSLHSQYGLTIQCDLHTGLLVMPRGSFREATGDNPIIIAFGPRGKYLKKLLEKEQTDIGKFVEKGVAYRKAFEAVLRKVGCIPLLDPKTGKVLRKVTSIDEYDQAIGELTEKHMREQGH